MRLHLVPEPLPQPLADLVVVRFGSTLPKARPGDHELQGAADQHTEAMTCREERAHLSIVVEHFRHRSRVQLRERASGRRIKEGRFLQRNVRRQNVYRGGTADYIPQ